MCKRFWFKKFLVVLILLAWLDLVAFWINLKFNSINVWLNVVNVNFSWPGNDFLGSLLIDKIVDLDTPQTITLNWESIECNKQLIWLYFNSQRWNRLRPIDQSSFSQLKTISSSYNSLAFQWWLFTNCNNYDSGSIFWFMHHTWGSTDYYLVAWTKMDYSNNTYKNSFANSFQFFDVDQWILSLWFVWDNHGWIWLVWWPSRLVWTQNLIGVLNNSWSIKSGFIYSGNNIVSTDKGIVGWRFENEYLDIGWTNFFWNLFVKGNVWISKSFQDDNSLSTTTQSEALLFNLSDVNVSTLVNAARRNASILCRDKRISWQTSLTGSKSDVLCFKNTNINIDLESDASKYWKKTIVLNNGNVILKKSMKWTNSPFELFIDRWSLYIQKPTLWDLETFNWDWYPDIAPDDNFKAEFLKWIFIVNWLIIWSGNWIIFPHKFVVHGKITSLNSPEPTDKRKQQVYSVLWTWYANLVDLDSIFVWSCNLAWTGSDLTKCYGAGDVVKKPFVIIDDLDKSMKYKLLSY